jgi:uncharacterized circularly permuted ATP-grasp superfamily protein
VGPHGGAGQARGTGLTGEAPLSTVTDAVEYWHGLLRPDVELTPEYAARFTDGLRAAGLVFGDRIHCPFLRPFLLDADQVTRIGRVAETLAVMGETIARAAQSRPELIEAVALTDAERRLVELDPGYPTASTSSRLDAFLLPDSLQFAEYNAESPAGFGYTEVLAGEFERLDVMTRFRERFEARSFGPIAAMLHALVASYREWGGTKSPPTIAIVDWREVPTWAEFEILQARFEALGVPTLIADPRDLVFDGRTLAARGRPIDLVYRRVLVNDILARPEECRALTDAYRARALPVANTFRCKIPHKKAFFAVLTDERFADLFTRKQRATAAAHVPWTRIIGEGRTTRAGAPVDLIPYIRAARVDLVIKPNDEYGGAGVTLGWEAAEQEWDETIARALSRLEGAWIVQERIPVRRETFPQFQPGGGASLGDMLVDCAPYLFRGRFAGFLTRLSATGLANVTSGGGQVPSFVVAPRPR